ncbi:MULTISPECIES: methyltransferase domain-containing protein [unclassified Caballeronia]|uniref:methyltransferase domain-containing protein n=1 Tax=unclassified Caballeronia TaxID=2646786 RepID=UPI0020295ADF|nr:MULTISPECIES: methyltransferase domain-containing protein [unclassified Caballeronia]
MSRFNQDYGQRQDAEPKGRHGDMEHREQELWLVAHLKQRSESLGRPVEVLDVGCGFGRMAGVLASCPSVVYQGYDASDATVRGMLDGPAYGPGSTERRGRAALSAPEASADRRFDIVFTVSTLIHHPPEAAAQLLSDMISVLRPDGYLVLIENQLVPFELREHAGHGGCWLHDFAGDLARDFDVEVIRERISGHDIYLVRTMRGAQRTVTLVEGNGVARPLADDERLLMSLPRVQAALKGRQSEREYGDAVETNATQARVIEEQRRALDARQRIIDEMSAERDTLRNVQQLRARIHQTLAQVHAESQAVHVLPDAGDDLAQKSFVRAFPPEHSFEWQAARDTMYANQDARFDQVCHVFHHDWMGMRSAVGALPGRKLSIPSAHGIPVPDIERIVTLLQQHGIRKLVLHGISDPMYALSLALARVGFDRQYLVWHGTTTQWVWEDERRFAHRAIQMAREGKVRRFSAIRRGLGPVVGERNFAPQLLNMPPLFSHRTLARRSPRREDCHALAPSWNDLRKNLATNVLAAQCVDRIGKVHVVAKDFDLPKWLTTKLTKVGYRDHTGMLEMMASMDIVLNVTTIDCHPMVDLEAMSVGTPCVRGPLFLDGLEDHEYVRATSVDNPMSVEDISQCIERVLNIETRTLDAMMSDYKSGLLELSRQRYLEFLEL